MQIIQNQSVDGIDTVSGATYSFKGYHKRNERYSETGSQKDTTKVTPTPIPPEAPNSYANS